MLHCIDSKKEENSTLNQGYTNYGHEYYYYCCC